MYKKVLKVIIFLGLSMLHTPNAKSEESIIVNGIEWKIFPSSNSWKYADRFGGYGSNYHVVDLEAVINKDTTINGIDTTLQETVRLVVGRFKKIKKNGYSSMIGVIDTLTYFVLYRFRMLDSTKAGVDTTINTRLRSYIHKIGISRDAFSIPLIEIDSIASLCSNSICDTWLPISEDSLAADSSLMTKKKTLSQLQQDGFNLFVDPLCDSMWAGVEFYLARPINPMERYSDTSELNNIYGEYKFVIHHRNGIDSLKDGFGVYSPFFIRKWDEDNWYEYDLEFFPPRRAIYDSVQGNLVSYKWPFPYAIVDTNGDIRQIFCTQNVILRETLRTFEEDRIIVPLKCCGDTADPSVIDIDIPITDRITEPDKYVYGHYVLHPATIKSNSGASYSIFEKLRLVEEATNTIHYRKAKVKVRHSGLTEVFDTENYPLSDYTTHYLLWLPGEIKSYGYNGASNQQNSDPILFHYVRHNKIFNTPIFNKDSLPIIKILHSSYYFLILKVTIVKRIYPDTNSKNDTIKEIYISWVSRNDSENEGFYNLSERGSWKMWWQNPHILLGGGHDSLFADAVELSFNWKPYVQLVKQGDTLYWNSLPSKSTNVEYHISYLSVDTTTLDTFIVDSNLNDSICFNFWVSYRLDSLEFQSDTTITWYPKLEKLLELPQTVKILWPSCQCSDLYEIWWKKDSSSNYWHIDSVYRPVFDMPFSGEEYIVKVRAVKNQTPMAWGVTGFLYPPTDLEGNWDINSNSLRVTWDDHSEMEDGYWIQYKHLSDTMWKNVFLPPNSTSFAQRSFIPDSIWIRVNPIVYANPIDLAGDIYKAEGESIVISTFFRVYLDSTYRVNGLALNKSGVKKAVSLVSAKGKIYTLSHSIIENGEGVESCVTSDTAGNFITLWNTGRELFLQEDTVDVPYLIYELEDGEIRGIALTVDTLNHVHIAAITNHNNMLYLLYGKGELFNTLTWDSICIKGDNILYTDLYGIASSLDGSSVIINYSYKSKKRDFYTFYKMNNTILYSWDTLGIKFIYNPVFLPDSGKFFFAYIDSTDTLRFISIGNDAIPSTPKWKLYCKNSNIDGYLNVSKGKRNSFPIMALHVGQNNKDVLCFFIIYYNDLLKITNSNLHRLLGMDLSVDSEDYIVVHYSYVGDDSIFYIDTFGYNRSDGGIQQDSGDYAPNLPKLYIAKTILNGNMEDLKLKIFTPTPNIKIKASLYNIAGRRVWHKEFYPSERNCNLKVSLKEIPQGVYFIYVKVGNKRFLKKIISLRL